MSTIVTRAGKGSALTHTEVDANFNNLNNDKIEAAQSVTLTNKTISGSNNTLSNIGNSSLTNSSVTIGSTSVSLGSTATTVSGLTLSSPTVNTPTLSGGTINNASVGATTPSSGAFTTLSASSTVSGTGFSTYLASPPAIGGTTPAAGSFTTLSATGVTTVQAGTVSAPAITTSGDTNTGIFFPAADTVAIGTGGTERLRVDSAGNAGLGVAPSAWASSSQAFQNQAGSLFTVGNGSLRLFQNVYYNSGAQNVYVNTAAASGYIQTAGSHQWFYAPSGTAGAQATFTQAMTLDASGNLGIGTSSPANKLHVVGTAASNLIRAQAASSGDSVVLRPGAAGNGGDVFSVNDAQTAYTPLNVIGSTIVFLSGTGGTERGRIDSSGNLLVGTTSNSRAARLRVDGSEPAQITGYGSGYGIGIWLTPNASASGGNATAISFQNVSNTTVGSISTTGSATSYVTSSDYRLKENIQPMTGALAKVAALKPCTYKWKADGSDGEGFIAHELAEVVPDAVTGEKDAVNEDGSIKPQGIDTSFLVATLTAAIQELNAKVEAQAAEIAALKGNA